MSDRKIHILDVTKCSSEIIHTEDGDYYRRLGPADWEEQMGESWEAVYDTGELEAAYRRFKGRRGPKR